MTSLAELEPLRSLVVEDVLDVPPEKIEEVEAAMLSRPDAKLARDYHVEHYFAPGVYMRQIYMPAGDLIIGQQHKTEHLNCIHAGRAAVMMDGKLHMIQSPMIFKSDAGVRKVLYIIEGPMIWSTVHVTPVTDLEQLEADLIDKSPSFKAFAEMKKLQELVECGEIC